MKSGMLAAETAYAALHPSTAESTTAETSAESSTSGIDMAPYETALKESWVWKELKEVRNLRPSFHNPLGLWGGMAYSGIDSLFLKGRVPWTFHHPGEDYAATKPAR